MMMPRRSDSFSGFSPTASSITSFRKFLCSGQPFGLLTQLPLSERERCAKAPPYMISTILFLAQQPSAPATGQSNPLLTFAPLIFMFILFHFLLLHPQRKTQKEHPTLPPTLTP